MKRRLQIMLLLLLTNYSFVYCQEEMTKNNNLKISILSFLDNAKIQYERTYNSNSSFGLTASYYYLKPMTGIKIEPTYRYYFKRHTPTGWYFEPKLLIGIFNTKAEFNKRLYVYNANDSLIKEEILEDFFMKKLTFIPIGASLKFGQQKFFGKNKRYVFDYNFGFQYFPYNYSKKDEQTIYYDTFGNRNVIVTSHGGGEPTMPANELFWYFFGAGSVFYSNISIGYNF